MLTLDAAAYRFRDRAIEWAFAVQTAAFGFILLTAESTFALPHYIIVQQWAREEVWGTMFLCIGIARLVSLMVNGSRPRGSPFCRVVLSILSAAIWCVFTFGLWRSGVATALLAFTPVLTIAEVINVQRASRDLGRAEMEYGRNARNHH